MAARRKTAQTVSEPGPEPQRRRSRPRKTPRRQHRAPAPGGAELIHGLEERYRSLEENAYDLIAEVTPDGRLLYVSPNHRTILGYDPSELLGRIAIDLIHPDDVPAVLTGLAQQSAQAVFRFRHKSGEWRCFEGSGKAYRTAQGERRGVIISRDITARKRAEEQLAASENRLRAIIAAEPECVKVVAPDGTLLEMNPAGLAMIEADSAADVVGKPVEGLVVEEYRAAFRKLTARACAGHEGSLEFEMIGLKGTRRWADTHVVPLRDERDAVVAALSVTRDITERKRAEALLRHSEDRYRNLVELSPDAILVHQEGRFVFANRAAAALLGASHPDELIGRPVLDFVHPEDHAVVQQRIEREFAGEPVPILEENFIRVDGRTVDVEVAGIPFTHQGRPAGQIVVRNITDRKRAEQRGHQEAEVSRALADLGRELIAALGTGRLLDRLCQVTAEVLRCDLSYTVGWEPEDDEFRPIAGCGATPEEQEVARGLRIPRVLMVPLLARLRRDDVASVGTVPPALLAQARQHRFGIGAVLCMALRRGTDLIGLQVAIWRGPRDACAETQQRIARGIAQVASLALEHQRVLRQLEDANRLKSEFVATMSHELRTPLNGIIGYTDLLIEGAFDSLTAEQVDIMKKIQRRAQEQLELINTTLNLSRLETGQLSLDAKDVKVAELIDEVDGETRWLQERSPLSFLWRVEPDLRVTTDPTKLKLVLKNLIGNAIKFTPHGSVTMDAYARQDGVEIAVADTGIGISSEALPIIFEPFRQADSSRTRRHGGVGLGLYIARRLLDALGGTVRVESAVGQGSTFRVWLPFESPRPRTTPHPPSGIVPKTPHSA